MSKFMLGTIVMTKKIVEKTNENFGFYGEVVSKIAMYENCNWDDMSETDKKANYNAVIHGGNITARYNTNYGDILIITDSDRYQTTIMFSDES